MKTKIAGTLLTLACVVGVGFQAAAAEGSTQGFNPQPDPPKIGARLLTPGSTQGIVIDNLPAPGAESAIDEALLGKTLGLGAGLPTLPTATQGGVALRGGNVMQQLGGDGQRPVGVGASSKALLPAVRTLPSAAAARSLQSAPSIQRSQGRKVAPITKSLRAVR